MLKKVSTPWSIDMWSFGALLLEILTGVPHWLSYKCRTIHGNKNIVKPGLFAVKG